MQTHDGWRHCKNVDRCRPQDLFSDASEHHFLDAAAPSRGHHDQVGLKLLRGHKDFVGVNGGSMAKDRGQSGQAGSREKTGQMCRRSLPFLFQIMCPIIGMERSS